MSFVQSTYPTNEGDNATLCIEVGNELARDLVVSVSGSGSSALGTYAPKIKLKIYCFFSIWPRYTLPIL